MTNNNPRIQPVPEGYHSVTPQMISKNTEQLLTFVKEVFQAEEIDRFTNEDGSIGHAEVRIGNSVIMMFDAKPEWPDTPCFLRFYVEDGDKVFEQALKAGATPVTELTELFFGDRVGRVKDPFGNIW